MVLTLGIYMKEKKSFKPYFELYLKLIQNTLQAGGVAQAASMKQVSTPNTTRK